MLIAALAIELVLMFATPVVLGVLLRRRWALPWRLLLIGAATFIASQVVHIPLNAGLTVLFQQDWMPKPPEAWTQAFNAIVLGLTAGLCEEGARYLVYRYWLKEARSWRQAILFGVGHGGIESALTGLLVLVTVLNAVALRNVDPTTLGLSPDQAAAVADQMAEFWGMPMYLPLLAGAERLMAILFHLSAAALVLQVFRTGRIWPLPAAIAWHAVMDAVAVSVNATWGAVAAEGSLAVLSLGSAAILWYTWRAERFALRTSSDSLGPGHQA
jgi:uncharacterized membrane protein YhfC